MRAGGRPGELRHPAARLAALLLAVAAGLPGCGQTGALYLPDDSSATVITRPGPAGTGNPTPAPPTSSEASAPSVPAEVPNVAPGAVPGAGPKAAPSAPANRPSNRPPANP